MKNKSDKKLWLFFAMIVIAGCAVITCGGETDTDEDKTLEPVTSPDNPVNRVEAIDLGVMASSESGWRKLLDSISNAGKYINLDLSACTMTGTSFNPDSAVSSGKFYIVSIILPAAATEIADGTSYKPTFDSFSHLKSVSGENITAIGEYSFTGSIIIDSILKDINFPKAASIGQRAFSNCGELQSVSFPLVTSIGERTFEKCKKLQSASFPLLETIDGVFSNCDSLITLNIPSITYIDSSAFSYIGGDKELSITMGATAPTLGLMMFISVTTAKTVRVKVPADAEGYTSFTFNGVTVTISGDSSTINWANGFRGGGWNESNNFYHNGANYINENITVIIELK
ncbi:MAG: leucine-rich repeat domain-containing protein [Treponema sp.]|nr:leucine-rich repeat domain-containing protein [Treponema sp.]